jgi:UDP-N-acetylmuramate--alanine ligase
VTAKGQRVHLVGIGGMHMSAIAQMLLADHIPVSGSDLVMTPLTDRLRALGARVHSGHDASNVQDATLVVTTAAAKSDNPELIEAGRRGIPIIPRHEMVARLMAGRTAVAVAGTHGKTTTSTLIAVILQHAGLEPAYLLGGESLDLGSNAAAGDGRQIVVEADEYAGAFLAYHPEIAVLTNIEADHLDYYGSLERLHVAFRQFLENVPDSGLIIACADSPAVREVVGISRDLPAARVAWYGIEAVADWRADEIVLEEGGGSAFAVSSPTGRHGPFSLAVPGLHNVSNAVAAFVVAQHLGIPDTEIGRAMASFHGAHRRFELVGEAAGVTVIDDYAHHPTEVRATLAAARSRYPNRRLVVLFQPHTYSRTQYLLEAFRNCFAGADRLYLLQTFAARETADAGIDAYALARALPSSPPVAESLAQAVTILAAELLPGDICVTMGAGDVTKAGPPLLEALNRR